jgi:hypothetical protein
MELETLGWKGKKVKHEDGREGVIIREYINFDFCDCTVRLTDGSTASFMLCVNENNKKAEGWSWWCEQFAGSPKWLPFKRPEGDE